MPLVLIIGAAGAEAAAAAAAATAATATAAAAAPVVAAAAPAAAAAAAPALISAAPQLGAMTAAEVAGGAGVNAGILSGEVAAAQGAGAGIGTGAGIGAATPEAVSAANAVNTANAGANTTAMELPVNAFPNPNNPAFTGASPTTGGINPPVDYSLANSAQGINTGTGTGLQLNTTQGLTAEGFSAPTVGEAGLQAPAPLTTVAPPPSTLSSVGSAFKSGIDSALKFTKEYPMLSSMGINAASTLLTPKPGGVEKKKYKGYTGNFQASTPSTAAYNPIYQPTAYAVGGPVEAMAAQNAVGSNMMYPQAGLQTPVYSNPQMSRPMAGIVVSPTGDAAVDPYTGEQRFATGGNVGTEDTDAQQAANNRRLMGIKSEQEKADMMEELKGRNARGMTAGRRLSKIQELYSPFTAANKEYAALAKKYGIPVAPMPKTSIDVSGSTEDVDFANGGITHGLGGYSDGGRLLRGPGDGVSDSIPAVIGDKQPARLADGEFVIPARIVSELGNGSTEAGARQLYAMMERIQKGRRKSIGKGKVAVNSKANKHLPK